MRRAIYLVSTLFPSVAFAEEPADLYVMKTPASPAFVALGIAPKDIQRPTTPSTFAANVLTKFERAGNTVTIPQGLALEVAPYWMVPQYDLDFKEYGNQGFESIYRNATLSVAAVAGAALAPETPETDPMAATSGTHVAVGVRTTVFHPNLSDAKNDCATQIHQALNESASVDAKSVDAEVRRRAGLPWTSKGEPIPSKANMPVKPEAPQKPEAVAPPVAPEPPTNPRDEAALLKFRIALAEYENRLSTYNAYRAALEEYEQALERHQQALAAWEKAKEQHITELMEFLDAVNKLAPVVQAELEAQAKLSKLDALTPRVEQCLRVIRARGDGLSMDVAGALGWRYPAARFEDGTLDRAFAWATLSYSAAGTTFIGLARYVGQRPGDDFAHGVDFGGRVVQASDRWGISAELVRREIDDNAQVRYAVALDYRATGDTWITLTLGKDYGEGTEGELLALANLQFNLGEQRLKPLENTAK